jgi:hypothetical protein
LFTSDSIISGTRKPRVLAEIKCVEPRMADDGLGLSSSREQMQRTASVNVISLCVVTVAQVWPVRPVSDFRKKKSPTKRVPPLLINILINGRSVFRNVTSQIRYRTTDVSGESAQPHLLP